MQPQAPEYRSIGNLMDSNQFTKIQSALSDLQKSKAQDHQYMIEQQKKATEGLMLHQQAAKKSIAKKDLKTFNPKQQRVSMTVE